MIKIANVTLSDVDTTSAVKRWLEHRKEEIAAQSSDPDLYKALDKISYERPELRTSASAIQMTLLRHTDE